MMREKTIRGRVKPANTVLLLMLFNYKPILKPDVVPFSTNFVEISVVC